MKDNGSSESNYWGWGAKKRYGQSVWKLGHCLRDVARRAVGQEVAELGGVCMGSLHLPHSLARHFHMQALCLKVLTF